MDATGRDPGSPKHTPQTRVFGGAVVDGAQRQKALVGVLSWTWHSIPITGRKPFAVVPLLARHVLSAACSLAVITRCSIVHAVAAIGDPSTDQN